jgi:hypothetical protein
MKFKEIFLSYTIEPQLVVAFELLKQQSILVKY